MVMPGWEKRLKPASFRGVPFGTTDYSTDGGRRVALHEYPFRDDNYPEDMGLSSDSYQIAAFVIGDDHDHKADALEAALRKHGAGELIHQRHGTLNVQIQTYQRSETTTAGGMTKFSITAVNAGKPRYPTASRNSQADTLAMVDSLRNLTLSQALATAATLLDTYSDTSLLTAQVTAAAQQVATSWLGQATSSLAAASSGSTHTVNTTGVSGGGVLASFSSVLGAVKLLPAALLDTSSGGWLQQAATLDAGAVQRDYPQALKTAVEWLQAIPATGNTPASLYLLPAAMAVEMATQTAAATALLPHESYGAAMTAKSQAHALLDALTPALKVISPTGVVDGNHYESLRELRVLVGDAIQQQALTLPEIAYSEVARDMPALVISHKLDSKANTTPNLIQRNGIPHPLFCAGTLEYLRG